MKKYTLVCTILCIILISTPYVANSLNSVNSTQTDGRSSTGSGDYRANLQNNEKGQTRLNPIIIGLGSTPVAINSSQGIFYFHYISPAADYLIFNLHLNISGVGIRATLQDSNITYMDSNASYKNYNSTVQENLGFQVITGLDIRLEIFTDVKAFDLTILLNRGIGSAGIAPSSAFTATLGNPQTPTVDKHMAWKYEFYNISLPSDDWYMLNATISSSFPIFYITIFNEINEIVYSNKYGSPAIDFFQVSTGNYVIRTMILGSFVNMTFTLSQRDPTPGYDLSHAVVVDTSAPVTFTSVTRYVYMNLTLDSTVFHTLTISIDNDTRKSQMIGLLIRGPDQIRLNFYSIRDPIILPKGQNIIFVEIDNFYTQKITFTASLSDVDNVNYGIQATAISIQPDENYTITTDYVGQQVWVTFNAVKDVGYEVITNITTPAFYKEDGTFLGYKSNFVGSGAVIYACFTTTHATSFDFGIKILNRTANSVVDYYSQNFKKGDYLEYKLNYTINGEKQDVFPYNANSVRVNILQNHMVINENEYLGYYLGFDFAKPSVDSLYYPHDSQLNLLLLPISSTGNGDHNSLDLLLLLFPTMTFTEYNQYYYVNSIIRLNDGSITNTTYIYDKINLNLKSYSSLRIWNNGRILNHTITLVNSMISGQTNRNGNDFVSSTVKTDGEAPVKTTFPMMGFVTTLIILPVLLKRSRKNKDKQ